MQFRQKGMFQSAELSMISRQRPPRSVTTTLPKATSSRLRINDFKYRLTDQPSGCFRSGLSSPLWLPVALVQWPDEPRQVWLSVQPIFSDSA
jgi:hypothetical protein